MALLASSGYDSLIEVELATGKINWHWFAWENGFNPDEDGMWLAATNEAKKKYQSEGKNTILIHPNEYGEQGLLISRRSAHPNCAVYENNTGDFILCSIGAHGNIYRISKKTGEAEILIDWLSTMPHGLKKHFSHWYVTNTTKGEFWKLDQEYKPLECYSFSSLEGKPIGYESTEWLQQVVPISKDKYMAIDSNRAIYCIDLNKKQYSEYNINQNYCVQDILVFNG